MSEITYTRLKDLVGETFKVLEVGEYTFKKWDNENKKMLTSLEWQKDYRKMYPVTTDKGVMDLGSGQLATLLETASYGGKSDLTNKTFEVKSNGKTGIDIRYFFNLVEKKPETEPDEPPEDYNY